MLSCGTMASTFYLTTPRAAPTSLASTAFSIGSTMRPTRQVARNVPSEPTQPTLLASTAVLHTPSLDSRTCTELITCHTYAVQSPTTSALAVRFGQLVSNRSILWLHPMIEQSSHTRYLISYLETANSRAMGRLTVEMQAAAQSHSPNHIVQTHRGAATPSAMNVPSLLTCTW